MARGSRLVSGGFHPPVKSPQTAERMHRRYNRDFLSHGIDNSIELNLAHRTLHCAGPAFCRQDGKRDRAEA
jgi:hypothetical protein